MTETRRERRVLTAASVPDPEGPPPAGTLYVLGGATGTLAWTAPIRSTLTPSGAVVGDVLYVTSDDRQIHGFDIPTRKEIWTFAIPGVPGSPAIVDGRIVVGTYLGKVVSLSGSAAASGRP